MAATQTGSRAGLITALVVFVVLFFVAAIIAAVKWVDHSKEVQARAQSDARYTNVIAAAELPRVERLAADLRQAEGEGAGRRTIVDILTSQRDQAARALAGRDASVTDARDIWNAAVKDADLALAGKITLSADQPSAVVSTLVQAILQRDGQIETLAGTVKKLEAEKQALVARESEASAQLEAAVAVANRATVAEQGKITAARQEAEQRVVALEQQIQDEIKKGREAADVLTVQVQGLTADLKQMTDKYARAVERLDRYKPKAGQEGMVRRPDGKIIQVSRNDVVYINLGAGQQITAGITFEIYDKNTGIPKAATSTEEEELPVGKASLEVVRVGPNSSECRLVRVAAGQHVVEGDLIANLIYNPNVKYTFRVYGNFDIDQNGVATAGEADSVRRLVSQWGGKLTDQVNTDTDFLVLGKEPVLPVLDEADPLSIFEHEKALEEQKKYRTIRDTAIDLHIPVLNQNRFLYLVGFYDQAQR